MSVPTNDCPFHISAPKLLPEAYYGLLTNPPGQYGRAKHGASTAFTLRGDRVFLDKAQNLFESFSGDTENGPLDGSAPRWREHRAITFREGNDKGSLFFCLSKDRFRKAISLYLYGQLVHFKGVWKEERDEEDGSFLGAECTNEGDLEIEADSLTTSFCANEVNPDYRAIPDYANTGGLPEHEYHDPFPS